MITYSGVEIKFSALFSNNSLAVSVVMDTTTTLHFDTLKLQCIDQDNNANISTLIKCNFGNLWSTEQNHRQNLSRTGIACWHLLSPSVCVPYYCHCHRNSWMIGATSTITCANNPANRALFFDTKLEPTGLILTELRLDKVGQAEPSH